MAKLNEKQRRFCQEYLVDWNGKQAAIRAGYSPRAATQTASRMLTRANVQDELQSLSAATTDRLGVTAERVVAELARIAFFDVRQLYGDDGNLKPIGEIDDDTAAGIAGLQPQVMSARVMRTEAMGRTGRPERQHVSGQTSGLGPSTPSDCGGNPLICSLINSRIIRTKRGCVPTVPARINCKPHALAMALASWSRSNRTST